MNRSESKYFNTAVRFDQALLALLENKSFEYITVSEICKEAQVNRSTFYLHYENTRELLEETTKYVMDNFVSYFGVDAEQIISGFSTCELEELNFIDNKYLYQYLSYIRENQQIFSAVLSQPNAFDSERILGHMFEYIFNPILDRFNYRDSERKYVMMFYLKGITAVIGEWLKDGCRMSIDEVSEIIRICIFGKDRMK